MPLMLPPREGRPRCPDTELHMAAYLGSTKRTIDVLLRGSIEVNQRNNTGWTPLMLAAQEGHSGVAEILLARKADVSMAEDSGYTALHLSAQEGHLTVTKYLISAGADVAARRPEGATPLHLASQHGHSEVMVALIEAGADVDSRGNAGATPLCHVATNGSLDAVKELLRAKANPLLTVANSAGFSRVPLIIAVSNGFSAMARELISRVGLEGCAGEGGGVDALGAAAMNNHHLDIMVMLTAAGVVDSGFVLRTAAGRGWKAAVKFLVQQRKLEGSPTDLVRYVNNCDAFGMTPLFSSIYGIASHPGVPHLISPKVVRLLIDAGAHTSYTVRVTNARDEVLFHGTLLGFTNKCIRKEQVGDGMDATEEHMHRLQAVRRLLLRVDAVHAVSWLWTKEPLLVSDATSDSRKMAARKTLASGTQLTTMLPVLRRRSRGLLLAALFR